MSDGYDPYDSHDLSVNKLEQICIGMLLIYLGLNVGLLYDLFLNSILCNLSFHILLIPDQLTVVKQPIELISQLVGDRQPLVE